MRLPRLRLLPALLGGMGLLLCVKLETLVRSAPPALPRMELVAAAQAENPAERPAGAPAPAPATAPPAREQEAERALLEELRARRTDLDAREHALVSREMVLAAAERRLAERIEELAALQQRLETADRGRTEREEVGWKQMVKLYEGMRPRDAAAIFDELELPVLVQIVDRMGERKAAPVLGAMRPERARQLTTELARHRARPAE